jgi:mono/diheme cytochrome c family protein
VLLWRCVVTDRCLRVGALFACVAAALGIGHVPTARPSVATRLPAGESLYREFCGQCHALSQAMSAGFGSAAKSGPGTDGGPSFNLLRVPYAMSIQAVTEPTGGHEKVRKRMTWGQIAAVATYIAKTTRHNPIPAAPTDG